MVQAIGRIDRIEDREFGKRLVIDASSWGHQPEHGESICVSGCCLTVAELLPDGRLCFDAIPETLARTTLGDLSLGHRVNFEHSVRADTLMGGHFVQGHVDAVGEITEVDTSGDGWRVRVGIDRDASGEDVGAYIAPKGSVTVAGVSLTVAEVGEGWFDVALIPTTLDLTTLKDLAAGDRVNIETDIIARQIVHYLKSVGAGGLAATAGTAGGSIGGAGA